MPQESNPTDLKRWQRRESYFKSWEARSRLLLEIHDANVDGADRASFSEYGCGPNAPFSSAVAGSGRTVARYDLWQWDDDCGIVDLNAAGFEVEASDCGVLSGVVEYLDDAEATLRRLRRHHRHLLLSYFPYEPRPWQVFAAQKAALVSKRAKTNGWRNHMGFDELIRCVAAFGHVMEARPFGRQILILAGNAAG